MNILISLAVAVIFIIACRESLRKHPAPYYIGAIALSAGVSLIRILGLSSHLPAFISDYIWPVFYNGGIAGALFIIVMWTGALPNRSKGIRYLMPIRGELSIMAGILTFGHGIGNGLTHFGRMIERPETMSTVQTAAMIVSIVLTVIMLPLFVTSFKRIRKTMKASSWKKLQRLAYVFYALLFAHVCLMYIPSALQGGAYYLTLAVYFLIYISYAICRVLKAVLKKANIRMLAVEVLGTVIAAVIAALALLLIYSNMKTPARLESRSVQKTEEHAALEAVIPEESEEDQETLDTRESTATPETATPETAAQAPDQTVHKYNDGTYEGSGAGYEGIISVSVTVENDRITDIVVTDQWEDPEFFEPVLSLIEDVLNEQHTDFDAISGSTYSSYGLLDAIDDALAKAR